MSVERGAIAYIVQEGKSLFLCVIDDEQGKTDRYRINLKGAARLASECAWAVNGALDGFNPPLLSGKQVAQRVTYNHDATPDA